MSVLLKVRQRILSSLLRRPSSLQDVSTRSYALCPPERQTVPPAIYLPRDLERVTSVMELTTMEIELRRLRGGERLHQPTMVYELENVAVSDGFLFKDGWKDRYGASSGEARAVHLENGTLVSTYLGTVYYGHWMLDDLTLFLAGERLGRPFELARTYQGHMVDYARWLEVHPLSVSAARIRKLNLIEDVGQNSFKRERYFELRRRLLSIAPPPDSAKPRRVMMHRGTGGVARLLRNELEIEAYLERLGFTIVDPLKFTVEELIQQLAGAEIVLGVEGSQMIHALFTMSPNGIFCALMPPYRFNNFYADHLGCLGIRYALLTGETAEGGFTISLDDMRELIDRLEKELEKKPEPCPFTPA